MLSPSLFYTLENECVVGFLRTKGVASCCSFLASLIMKENPVSTNRPVATNASILFLFPRCRLFQSGKQCFFYRQPKCLFAAVTEYRISQKGIPLVDWALMRWEVDARERGLEQQVGPCFWMRLHLNEGRTWKVSNEQNWGMKVSELVCDKRVCGEKRDFGVKWKK